MIVPAYLMSYARPRGTHEQRETGIVTGANSHRRTKVPAAAVGIAVAQKLNIPYIPGKIKLTGAAPRFSLWEAAPHPLGLWKF